MSGRERFPTHAGRKECLFGFRAVERPAMAGHGDHLDTCGAFAHPASRKQIHQRNAGPALLAPPSAGAIEHDRCLAARERGQIGVGKRDRSSGRRSADAESPGVDIDVRHAIEAPDRHGERVAGEGARVVRSAGPSCEHDAVERDRHNERSGEQRETAESGAPPGERDERGTRLASCEHVGDDDRAEREPGDDVEIERGVREWPVK